jgi:4-amino-4-deoxy-L-arabinose transferase-like glycosyltransferase
VIAFIKKYPFAFLMIVSLLMLLAHLGTIQTNIMEARNLITAREMAHDGHWIFTTINGLPRYEKPPLPTWITAVFGVACNFKNMFLLRLPVALVCLMLVYFFYKLMANFELTISHSLNASLILITSFYIFFAGRDNQWDMYTHAFMIPCLFFLIRTFNESKKTITNPLLSALFLGCSFLSKGPVSLYALFLPFLISHFIVYKSYTARNIKMLLLVLVIGLMIGFSWPLYVKYFDANAAAALSKQTQNWGDYEVKPFWYYWSFFTQSGIWTLPSLIALMYFYLRRRVNNVKAYRFGFLWTVISLLLLSAIPEKKARYTLPILIPLAMNTSFYIEYLIHNFKQIKSKAEGGLVYFSFGLIAFIAFTIPFAVFFMFRSKLDAYIFWFVALTCIAFSCGIFILKGLYKKEFIQTFYATVLFMCGIIVAVVPLSKVYYSNKNYSSAANLHDLEKKYNIKTYEGDDYVPEIIWDYGNKIPNISSGQTVTMPKDSVLGLLVYPDKANLLIKQFNNYSFTRYALVDLNEIPKESKGYNPRLVKDYYLVKKLY